MESILEWLSKYSLPVVVLIAFGAVLLYFMKLVTEKVLDHRFKQHEKELGLRLERRSRFEEKLLLDQYLLATELFHKVGKIATDINRHRHGTVVEGLYQDKELVQLTQVYEDLTFKRYLLGPRFHSVLRRLADVVLAIARADEDSRKLAGEYLQLVEEFNQIAIEEFGIKTAQ